MLPAIIAAALGASAPHQPPMLLRPRQTTAVIGRDGAVTLDLRAVGIGSSEELPRFFANVGQIGRIERKGPDVFTARFRLPDAAVPAIAVILASWPTPDGRRYAVTRIRLLAEAEITIKTSPGAEVSLWAAGRRHGPVITDATGTAKFLVPTLRPELTYRYRIKLKGARPVERSERAKAGARLSRITIAPPANPDALAPGDTFTVAAAAATEDGGRAPPERIRCGLTEAELIPAARVRSDLAVFELTVPAGNTSALALHCRTSDGAVARRRVMLGTSPPPARFALWMPSTYRAGNAFPLLVVEAFAEDGSTVTLPDDLQIRATLPSETDPRDLPVQPVPHVSRKAVQTVIPIPNHFEGAREVVITVSTRDGDLSEEKGIRLRAASPVAMRVTGATAPVVVSTRERRSLRVDLLDHYGNVARRKFRATAALGTVRSTGGGWVEYSPPLSANATADTITFRSGDILHIHPITLTAPSFITIQGGTGVLVTHNGAAAPALVLNAGYTRQRLSGVLSLSSAQSLGRRFRRTVGDDLITVRSDWRAFSGTGTGVYIVDVAPQLALHLGLGLGASLYATDVELRVDTEVARPRRNHWEAAFHLATATGVEVRLADWGVALNLNLAYEMPAHGRSPLLRALASLALCSRWGWP